MNSKITSNSVAMTTSAFMVMNMRCPWRYMTRGWEMETSRHFLPDTSEMAFSVRIKS
jgi:hypothetical protein